MKQNGNDSVRNKVYFVYSFWLFVNFVSFSSAKDVQLPLSGALSGGFPLSGRELDRSMSEPIFKVTLSSPQLIVDPQTQITKKPIANIVETNDMISLVFKILCLFDFLSEDSKTATENGMGSSRRFAMFLWGFYFCFSVRFYTKLLGKNLI